MFAWSHTCHQQSFTAGRSPTAPLCAALHTSSHLASEGPAKTTPDRRPSNESRTRRKLAPKNALLRIVDKAREALWAGVEPRSDEQMVYKGTGSIFGCKIRWSLRCRPDGAFREEIYGDDISITCGHDGKASSPCWNMDHTRVPVNLELDEHEAMLLSFWTRTGLWVKPEMRDSKLTIKLDKATQERLCPPHTSVADAGRAAQLHLPSGGPSTSTPSSISPVLGLNVKRRESVSWLTLNPKTFRPESLVHSRPGRESWQFKEWREAELGPDSRMFYPAKATQHADDDGVNRFFTEEVLLEGSVGAAVMAQIYAAPPSPMRPADTTFLGPVPADVPAWWTASGHLVVRPLVDGHDVGYMILDTGASGCAIEKDAADELGLHSFGDMHVISMLGRVKSCFRKGRTLQVGPLEMQAPVFMQLPLKGLVWGVPDKVVGILGYEVMRRAVLELPPRLKPGARNPQEVRVRMYDPQDYVYQGPPVANFQKVFMLANLPHISATFSQRLGPSTSPSPPAKPPAPALFMLDSGAGNLNVMFHQRAVRKLGLLSAPASASSLNVKAVGRASPVKMEGGMLSHLQLGPNGRRFEDVACLFSGDKGLDVSLYISGIICSNLMSKSRVILDYPRRRVAFIDDAERVPRRSLAPAPPPAPQKGGEEKSKVVRHTSPVQTGP